MYNNYKSSANQNVVISYFIGFRMISDAQLFLFIGNTFVPIFSFSFSFLRLKIIRFRCHNNILNNKIDLIKKNWFLSLQGLLLAKHIGAIAYYECSSKTADESPESVNSLFETAALASTGQAHKISKEYRTRFDKKKNKAYEKCTIS